MTEETGSQEHWEDPFEKSNQPGNIHHRLAALAGTWEGTTRTWFEPGQLADESPNRGTIRPILDGRFMLHEYEGSLMGEPMQGLVIYGYHIQRGNFEAAWVDNRHTGTIIFFSEGKSGVELFKATTRYDDPSGGPQWSWRTEIEMPDPDHLIITAYNILPTGEEAKAVETKYQRIR